MIGDNGDPLIGLSDRPEPLILPQHLDLLDPLSGAPSLNEQDIDSLKMSFGEDPKIRHAPIPLDDGRRPRRDQADAAGAHIEKATGILSLPVQGKSMRTVLDDGDRPAAFLQLTYKPGDQAGFAAAGTAYKRECFHPLFLESRGLFFG